ncbi:hypothetical protein X975_22223, partial [Stegodyphus mimosarum]
MKVSFLRAICFIHSWCLVLNSNEFCEYQLDINQYTVVDSNTYMREVCGNALMHRLSLKIGGIGIVEVDEGLFSCQKKKKMLTASFHSRGFCSGLNKRMFISCYA